MAGVAGAELAAAVSAAGGLGLVGGGYGEGDWLQNELRKLDGSLPFGVGFITWRLAARPELLDVALAHRPLAVLLSFGDISPYVDAIKSANVLLIAQVQSLGDARRAAERGADVIVAQGTEAGGHGSSRATMSLVPAVVDAVGELPVVAAGGIADGRGFAAALMLGACGVMMGSRFYASVESMAPAQAKARALAAGGDDTTRSSVFDVLRRYDWPKPYKLRTLKNALLREYENDIVGLLANKDELIERFETAVAKRDYDQAPVIVGEAVDLIHDVPPAAAIVDLTCREMRATISAAAALLTE